MLKNLFIREGRLRSGWRLISYIVVSRLVQFVVALLIGLGLTVYLFSQGTAGQLMTRITALLSNFEAAPAVFVGNEALLLAITAAIVYIWRHALDKRSFRSLGFQLARGWWQEFLLGAGLIALTWTVIFGFSIVTSAVVIQAPRLNAASLAVGLGLGLVFNLLVGFTEELDARGYVLQTLAEGVKFWPAVVISALYFGALHLLNPGADAASTIGVALFGAVGALAYWATGRLWMPIGMHAAWNFFEGPVFGFLVSGIQMGGLFDLRVQGPEWLTGGRFGPEAGALTMVPQVVLIGILFVWGRARRRKGNNLQASVTT